METLLTSTIRRAGAPARPMRMLRLLTALAAAAVCAAPAWAQTSDVPVGRIEGDDISVRGEVRVVNENGHTYTSLASGSQVTVRSGRARIELAGGGGEIGICGPARFSLVRAGASLTLALDYGRVRARVADPDNLRIYTPQVAASPIAASGRADDVSVGLDDSGKMCVLASRGALRLEPQFGGDSIVVPQGTEATLREGQLASLGSTPQACACDALEAARGAAPPANSVARVPLNAGTPAADTAPQSAENKTPPPAPSAPGEQPIWKITMPPLAYTAGDEKISASAKGASLPPPSAQMVTLFREVYVEPVIVWRGAVEEPAKEPAKPAVMAQQTEQAAKKPSFGTRVANFFRRLFGGKPKQQQQPQSA